MTPSKRARKVFFFPITIVVPMAGYTPLSSALGPSKDTDTVLPDIAPNDVVDAGNHLLLLE